MTANTINEVLNFINSNIDEKASILVLPEGPVINFMSNRKVDLHCFMMVRLYHDALGDETAKDTIAKTNSDYIILLNLGEYKFERPNLYDNNTPSHVYILKNYYTVFKYPEEGDIAWVTILKKKVNSKF